jgi:hypothetical protein
MVRNEQNEFAVRTDTKKGASFVGKKKGTETEEWCNTPPKQNEVVSEVTEPGIGGGGSEIDENISKRREREKKNRATRDTDRDTKDPERAGVFFFFSPIDRKKGFPMGNPSRHCDQTHQAKSSEPSSVTLQSRLALMSISCPCHHSSKFVSLASCAGEDAPVAK